MIDRVTEKVIFVFGSNLAGRHGKGAALTAMLKYGAKYGVGAGLTGASYALPTKDRGLRTLPLNEIKVYVDEFMEFAKAHYKLTFAVTRIGCGLAGYSDAEIAPMFAKAPVNCELPEGWKGLRSKLGIQQRYLNTRDIDMSIKREG